jgi:hypothetical protein
MGRYVVAAVVLAVVVTALLYFFLAFAPVGGPARRELWLYDSTSLADSAGFARLEPLWRRAARAGYSHVVLVDPRFARPADQDAVWLARAHSLVALADSLKLEIVPGVCLCGRAQGAILAADPNLAEAFPVRDALLEVRGGIARVVADPPVALAAKPDRVDPGVRLDASGARLEARTRDRIAWEVDVSPWRCYHVAFRLRGEGFQGEPRVRVTANGREQAYAWIAPPTGDSACSRDVVFNSQDARHVTVSFAIARSGAGLLHWSDWRMSECGPVNLVRRPGLPFRITGLEESRDFEPVADSLLGRRPWRGQFDAWHEPPAIRVHRPDGTRLRASWYHAAVLLKGQVACCLADSAVRRRQRQEIADVRRIFGARSVFLMHDEIRVMGQDATCLTTGRVPGDILAEDLRELRAAAGGARVLVWNDMVDPRHNAVSGYYLVRGDLSHAIAGLDTSVTIVNWNHARGTRSLRWFAERGFAQVWADYYDGPPGAIARLRSVLDHTPGVRAVMYTTWQDRFDDLEAFARAAR